MKVIFCDIDGVLNSKEYDAERATTESFIDKSRLPILKNIIDATCAKLVLSSSWRCHWDKDESKCDEIGVYIDGLFKEYGIEIYDKTSDFGGAYNRESEIQDWLDRYKIEDFVIIDDYPFGWEKLSENLILTKGFKRGLDLDDALRAIQILNNGNLRGV